jgi:carboxymethylenebutenolidase
MISSDSVMRQQIAVTDGTQMSVHYAKPKGPAPGIIVLQEAFGVNEYIRQVVARFAGCGFAAIAPELYHRSGDGLTAPYGDREVTRQLGRALSVEGQVADVAAAHEWLTSEAGVEAGRIAVVGFCMGGRSAYLANGHLPLAAAITFYGGRIAPDHLDLAPQQNGRLLMFWGGQDRSIPKEQRRAVEDALDASSICHQQVVFSQAQHGFFGHLRDEYDAETAELAWKLMYDFLSTNGLAPESSAA